MAASSASENESSREDQKDIIMDGDDVTEEQQDTDEEMDEEDDMIVNEDKVDIISGGSNGDQTAMTFSLKDEDHTIGNPLRHMINKNPQVDFCGYSIPHPSEAKMHIRIQTSDKTTAVDAFRKGLSDLTEMCTHIRDAYEAELAKKEYVVFEEVV